MGNKYDIDSLIEAFELHSKEVEKNLNDHPEWKYSDFNIALAFLEICKELKKLKDFKEDFENG